MITTAAGNNLFIYRHHSPIMKYVPFVCVLLLLLSAEPAPTSPPESCPGPGSQTVITIEPHIGENTISVTQTYTLTQEGLLSFEILTIALSYADLHVFDKNGDLAYIPGRNVIVGKNVYRILMIPFFEPIPSPYTFTVTYWFPTFATGKPVTGKYTYSIVSITDSTTLNIVVPLPGMRETSASSPAPSREAREDSTVFSYHFTEDTTISLTYEPEKGIDYEDTATATFTYSPYTFTVIYPKEAEALLDDIESFVKQRFPAFLEETGYDYGDITIELTKEEDTWAAAEYRGSMHVRILINNGASYPSYYITHELVHSRIGRFPRYLEEGIASYYEGKVNSLCAPPLSENYVSNREAFYQTYERQFDTVVDIAQDRYGLALTDHQQALIYAKYSKGAAVIYEIAKACGSQTLKEMLFVFSERGECDINCMIYHLSQGNTVYEILKKYGFDVVPPYAYPAERLLNDVESQSWWSHFLCSVYGFKQAIRTAGPEEIGEVEKRIQETGKIAEKTFLLAEGALLTLVFLFAFVTIKKGYHLKKKNPRVVYYVYMIPVVVSFVLFAYLLYQFLMNGSTSPWIAKNILVPWGCGLLEGAAILLLAGELEAKRGMKYITEVVWSLLFFVLLIVAVQAAMLLLLFAALGYTASLAVLFAMRRRAHQ